MKPELSIIMPCYNCSDTLEEAVESCFAQGLGNFEIVMVDDGSTDETREVMRVLADKHPEIKLFYHDKNMGGGASRNTAVDKSSAEIIFCLDGDDILPENTLSKMLSFLKEKMCDGVLFEETRFFSGKEVSRTEIVKNTKIDESVEFEDIFKANQGFITKVNFLYTKYAFQVAGGYPVSHGFDTQAFGCRFLSRGLRAYVCPNTYYLHRRHAKDSYFDREYKKGNLSLNTYLVFEDFFFLFSSDVKDIIINFDITKGKKLNKNSLEQIVISRYIQNPDTFFIGDYKKYLTPEGEKTYFAQNESLVGPTGVFARAIFLQKSGLSYLARPLFESLVKVYPRSKILNLKVNRKIVLLMHNGGRLGNQLWWMASFYAYCLEKGYVFDVRCFFEYQEYFNIKIESLWAKSFGRLHHYFVRLGFAESVLRDIFYGLFTFWSEMFAYVKKECVVFDTDEQTQKTLKIYIYKRYKTLISVALNIFRLLFAVKKTEPFAYATTNNQVISFLPPSIGIDSVKFCDNHAYFYGWLFRNPEGMIKYQKEILEFFTPKEEIVEKVTYYLNDLRKSYSNIIGVHVRLGDVVNEYMNNDRIAYTEDEVFKILKEYLKFSNKDPRDTCFVICSDGEILESTFKGLHVMITHNNAIEDLWLLSKTDVIIGADSSFAITASFFGDIPFIVFKRGIDWNYYVDKKRFFVNKYVERFIY